MESKQPRPAYFERLGEKDRREQPAGDGDQPFLTLRIAELDSTSEDDEDRDDNERRR